MKISPTALLVTLAIPCISAANTPVLDALRQAIEGDPPASPPPSYYNQSGYSGPTQQTSYPQYYPPPPPPPPPPPSSFSEPIPASPNSPSYGYQGHYGAQYQAPIPPAPPYGSPSYGAVPPPPPPPPSMDYDAMGYQPPAPPPPTHDEHRPGSYKLPPAMRAVPDGQEYIGTN